METKFNIAEGKANFEFALTKEEWEKEISDIYEKNKGKYKIPGFRPGHAPRKMIELHYGPMVFIEDAMDACVQRCYYEALDAHKELEIYGMPDVKLADAPEGGFAFTASVGLVPEVKLGSYKKMKLEKIEYNVTDEDVQRVIDGELRKASRMVEVDRPAQNGDTVNIDFSGFSDGVQFEGGTAEKHDLELGSHSFIPGFEEQLVGKKAGDECDVNVKFPDDYQAENLKGKDAVFKVKVNKVSCNEVPALDDKFAKEHAQFDTVDEYRKDIENKLKENAAARQKNDRFYAALKAAADASECEVPEGMIQEEVDGEIRSMENNVKQYKMSLDTYLGYMGTTLEEYRKDLTERAGETVKFRLVLRAIAKAEKFLPAAEEETEEETSNEVVMNKLTDLLLTENEFTEEKKEEAAKKPAAKKTAAKKSEPKDEEAATKPAAKKTTKKAASAEGEAAKPVAKKTTKKPAAETADAPAAKKPAAKKTTKKADGNN